MPPHTFLPPARLLYFFTALVAASIVATVQFAGAGQPEAQCKGNSPKKVCPTLLPADGATVAAAVTVTAEVEEAVASIAFAVDSVPLGPPDTTAPYQATWDTTKIANGTYVLRATAVDPSGKLSAREHEISVSNATAPPPPPSDTTAPTVTLTSPAAGATVSGSVALAANASDNVAVVGVQFKIDGADVGSEDTSAPYSVSWSSGNVPNGTHTVTAVARDAAGNSSETSRTITVSNSSTPPPGDTTLPSVALTSPVAGATVSGSVNVAANAADNVGVVGVQFKIDGGNLGAEDTSAPYSASWSSGNVSNGTHSVTAVARDAAGNTASSQRSVTVSNTSTPPPPDTTAPTVALTNPAAGATVSGAVNVAANATDNVAVVGVQFKIDGGNLGAEDTTAPYSVSWSSGNVPN
ncbi:MAG: Ig-like domain-containing protein, partial [Gaiellaceae bacterium]